MHVLVCLYARALRLLFLMFLCILAAMCIVVVVVFYSCCATWPACSLVVWQCQPHCYSHSAYSHIHAHIHIQSLYMYTYIFCIQAQCKRTYYLYKILSFCICPLRLSIMELLFVPAALQCHGNIHTCTHTHMHVYRNSRVYTRAGAKCRACNITILKNKFSMWLTLRGCWVQIPVVTPFIIYGTLICTYG